MAGRNMWHTPFFQPQLNNSAKFSNSKDRYRWESQYNGHLKRLQIIQGRQIYRPEIIKRTYPHSQYHQLDRERARAFAIRTQLNRLPLSGTTYSSRENSAASSRAGSPVPSPRGSRTSSTMFDGEIRSAPESRAVMEPIEETRRQTIAAAAGVRQRGEYSHFYPEQNFPVMSSRPASISRNRRTRRKTREQRELEQERDLFGYPPHPPSDLTSGDEEVDTQVKPQQLLTLGRTYLRMV